MSRGLPEGDESAGEVEESAAVRADSLPSDEQFSEAVVPGVGALHDPAARLVLDPAEERLLAPAPNVGRDPANANGSLGVGVVVHFVEAEVLGPVWIARRTQDDSIEYLNGSRERESFAGRRGHPEQNRRHERMRRSRRAT